MRRSLDPTRHPQKAAKGEDLLSIRFQNHRHVYALLLITAPTIATHGCATNLAPDPHVRYVAFGDSTTRGAAARDYVDFLPTLLGEPQNAFVNRGHGGETTQDGLQRLRHILNAQQYPNAVAWLYWEGGNDLIEFIQLYDPLLINSPNDPDYPYGKALAARLDDTQANVEAGIATLRQAGLAVLVATVFPVSAETTFCPPLSGFIISSQQAAHANAYVDLLNNRIRIVSERASAVLVDVALKGEVLRSGLGYYADCNHLSASGNEIVAGCFAESIQLMSANLTASE